MICREFRFDRWRIFVDLGITFCSVIIDLFLLINCMIFIPLKLRDFIIEVLMQLSVVSHVIYHRRATGFRYGSVPRETGHILNSLVRLRLVLVKHVAERFRHIAIGLPANEHDAALGLHLLFGEITNCISAHRFILNIEWAKIFGS